MINQGFKALVMFINLINAMVMLYNSIITLCDEGSMLTLLKQFEVYHFFLLS